MQIKLRRLQNQYWNDPGSSQLLLQLERLLKTQQAHVRKLLSEYKHEKAGRLRNRLMLNDSRLNNFWKFVRQHCKSTQHITASYDESGNVVFDPDQVSKEVLRQWSGVFSGQETPVFTDDKLPPLPQLHPNHPILRDLPKSDPTKHEAFLCRPFTRESLKRILMKLKDKKAVALTTYPQKS